MRAIQCHWQHQGTHSITIELCSYGTHTFIFHSNFKEKACTDFSRHYFSYLDHKPFERYYHIIAQSAKRESEIMNILINPNRNKLCQGSQRTFSTCSQGGCKLILYKLRRKLWDIDTPTEMLTEDNDMRLQRNYRLLIRGSYLNSPAVTERFLVALLILKTFGNKKSFILEAAQRETIFF